MTERDFDHAAYDEVADRYARTRLDIVREHLAAAEKQDAEHPTPTTLAAVHALRDRIDQAAMRRRHPRRSS
jgi:non-homologous end joining protein Ku